MIYSPTGPAGRGRIPSPGVEYHKWGRAMYSLSKRNGEWILSKGFEVIGTFHECETAKQGAEFLGVKFDCQAPETEGASPRTAPRLPKGPS